MSAHRTEKREFIISKLLSYLLRHGAVKEKLHIDSQGWVSVDSMLSNNRLRNLGVTQQDIEQVVTSNDKQRFKLKQEESSLFICANQGHTLAHVAPDLALLTLESMPANVYHGTYESKLASIEEGGLKRMSRNHIHLTSDADWSVLGIRKNCSVLIYIDTTKCINDGYEFWRSANGVVLCDGKETGCIPPRYFRKIERLKRHYMAESDGRTQIAAEHVTPRIERRVAKLTDDS